MSDASRIEDLALALDLRVPAVDSEGRCDMALAPGLAAALRVLTEPPLLQVAIPLGHTVTSSLRTLYETLLQANTPLVERGEAHFALTPDAQRVVLCRTLQVERDDVLDAAAVLRRMALVAQGIQAQLRSHQLITD